MKFSAFILVFLFLFSFSNPTFSQSVVQSEKDKKEVWLKRTLQIKSDILQEISTLPNKEQAEYYGIFGDTILSRDKKEGSLWLAKAIEIALNPATDYKDNKEKITVLGRILVFDEVLENEETLFKKPLAEIVKILNQEVNEKRSDEYGDILISTARQLLKKDEKLALNLAILSLKGNKPAFNWSAYLFLKESKKVNETLSNQYFAKMLEVAKTSGKIENLYGLLRISFSYSDVSMSWRTNPQNISDLQKKDLLELLLPHIQNESDELLQKKRDNCNLTKAYGKRFLEDYKKLSPQNAAFIEQALNVCQMSPIVFWKKPDFEAKNSQDYLNLAKQSSDKVERINFTMNAASHAGHHESNYRLAVEILDNIDEESKKLAPNIPHWWKTERLQSGSGYLSQLFNKGDVAEIRQFIENTPPDIRPFMVIRAISSSITYSSMGSSVNYNSKNKQLLLGFLDEAKTDFFKMEIPNSQNDAFFGLLWLSSVNNLTRYYYNLGDKDEAIYVHEEYIKFLNREQSRLSSEKSDVKINSFFHYQSLPKEFLEKYFEQIYLNTGKINNLPTRISFRINLFREVLYSSAFIK